MNISKSKNARLVVAASVCGVMGVFAKPGLAQTVEISPVLSFPDQKGPWGCKWNGTCKPASGFKAPVSHIYVAHDP